MGFLDIFKKKQIATITRPQQPTVEQVITQIYQQTGKQIADGLNRPTASTGKSIDELHGAAKRIAQISNIGGGSKSTGGGGLDKGLDTVAKHVQARTAIAIIDNAKQKKLGKGKT